MELTHTTSSAGRVLGIPAQTIIGLERRGVVGPFRRTVGGHRLLSKSDVAEIRAYLDRARGKKKAA
jgi:DNA-binding transcriptional MerR regulator